VIADEFWHGTGSNAWGTGYQFFNFVIAAGASSNLVAGALYYIDVVNNATGTVPKLSGITTLAAEVNGALAANGVRPYRWATNSASQGSAPPVVGSSTLSYANNTAVSLGFFAGLL
jgi:hypothetical protein